MSRPISMPWDIWLYIAVSGINAAECIDSILDSHWSNAFINAGFAVVLFGLAEKNYRLHRKV